MALCFHRFSFLVFGNPDETLALLFEILLQRDRDVKEKASSRLN